MDGGPLRTADAPVPGTVVSVSVQPGSVVGRTTVVVVLEVMKMEHHVEAGVDGTVSAVHVGRGDTVAAGQPLVAIAAGGTAVDARPATVDEDLGAIRPDLAEVLARTARTTATRSAPMRSRAVTPWVDAPPGRISPTSSTRAPSSSTAPSSSPPSGPDATSRS